MVMAQTERLCPCGKPLHYASPENEAMVEELVAQLGEDVRVTVGDRSWLVPRHYIALHGLKAWELAEGRVACAREVTT